MPPKAAAPATFELFSPCTVSVSYSEFYRISTTQVNLRSFDSYRWYWCTYVFVADIALFSEVCNPDGAIEHCRLFILPILWGAFTYEYLIFLLRCSCLIGLLKLLFGYNLKFLTFQRLFCHLFLLLLIFQLLNSWAWLVHELDQLLSVAQRLAHHNWRRDWALNCILWIRNGRVRLLMLANGRMSVPQDSCIGVVIIVCCNWWHQLCTIYCWHSIHLLTTWRILSFHATFEEILLFQRIAVGHWKFKFGLVNRQALMRLRANHFVHTSQDGVRMTSCTLHSWESFLPHSFQSRCVKRHAQHITLALRDLVWASFVRSCLILPSIFAGAAFF